jgi:hypothetical protein
MGKAKPAKRPTKKENRKRRNANKTHFLIGEVSNQSLAAKKQYILEKEQC